MKRRGFVKGLLVTHVVTPALPLLAEQTPAPATAPPPVAPPARPGSPAKLTMVQVDAAAQTTQHFFKPDQFAALEKLGDVLVPPIQGKPGATEAEAAVFLDFLISESPVDRQKLYLHGLDALNSAARKHFSKPFSDLDAQQAGTILKPLLVPRFWSQDVPDDPVQHFIAQAHDDFRTATGNSRQWAQASSSAGTSGRRGFNRAAGLYWNPIDPVGKG
jgi:hypothetical protein